ncbi:MAG: hypothetical protein M1834_000050 [Cirrosporium novae-zelandiae]|nr:MAG: hypothetical protein M1834_000050 [Cirrosporium novae-zelandiae]
MKIKSLLKIRYTGRRDPTEDLAPTVVDACGIAWSQPKLGIVDLPLELLGMICSHLSPTSLACFLLSSKQFYQLLDTTPFACLEISRQWNYYRIKSDERFKFLTLLEKDLKDSWAFCHTCYILHPADHFSKANRKRPAYRRSCKIGGEVVGLCCCREINFLAFISAIKRMQKHGSNIVWHQCTMKPHRGPNVLHTKVLLYPNHDNLFMELRYQVLMPVASSPEPVQYNKLWRIRPFFLPESLCPHCGLNGMLYKQLNCFSTHVDRTPCSECSTIEYCTDCYTKAQLVQPSSHDEGYEPDSAAKKLEEDPVEDDEECKAILWSVLADLES